MTKGKLLIIDDDEAFCGLLEDYFREEYNVKGFTDPVEAVSYFRGNGADVVLTDVVMPKMDGMKILQFVKAESFDTDVIIMTAFGKIDNAVESMKKGAYDYIVKPFTIDELSVRLRNVFEKRRLVADSINLKKIVDSTYRPENIIGESKEMKKLFQVIEILSGKDVTALITGESGTGKELVAKALHFSGARKDKIFVSINCAAVPETLLESELFGYMKGAFTGAAGHRKGLFEYAEGGTLFLDEIADAPLSIQAKLLRALQERKIRPLGGREEVSFDVRLICATNKDLRKVVREKKFREDLYYRINVVSVHLPPLRERHDDIPLLISHFLGGRKNIHPMAVELLSMYAWPGNVRELKNMIESLATLTGAETIKPDDLPPEIIRSSHLCDFDEAGPSYSDARKRLMDDFNRAIIKRTLLKNYGNVTKAAEELRLDRRNLQRLMKRYQIASHDAGESAGPNSGG